ncbi:ROK family protein [Polaribacter sp. Z014]|uniref:polyphosphate--glucose phosphotransferase n=1 Tax=unclassified Polaribacter TaxID=196858 RepID=UPI00193AE2A7|nr:MULTISPECIES: ROK family protein [unclassified Polaribacter]MCL7763908.1 ROK family protein [Polaribacter sp. Z014]QVY66441.1 ROK family protein [Polaribacter sp. Q13]
MKVLGIDIGGSGIKAAIVNTKNGELLSERHRIDTPKPAEPKAVAKVIKEMVKHFDWKGPVGCCFPTIIVDGQCKHHGNLSEEWVDVKVNKLFKKACDGVKFYVSNDADLAGVAEMSLGAGKDVKGKVFVITIGTGLGSGLFYDGKLIPNVELGRIYHTNGEIIERFAADSARKREELTLTEWAKRFDIFLNHVKTLHTPTLFILGGGISKRYDEFKKHLTVDVPIEVAEFKNNAGIIGAAMFAHKKHKK